MTESRIQDWIRYVQERAENVPEDETTTDDNPATTGAPAREMHSREAHSRELHERETHKTPARPVPGQSGPSGAGAGTSSAAVARAGSRIRRVVAASGRTTTPPAGATVSPDAGATSPGTKVLQSSDVATPLASASVADVPTMRPAVAAAIATAVTPATAAPATAAPAMVGPGKTSTQRAARVPVARDAAVRQRVRQRPETRTQMLERLTNPTISLYEASVLLDVCSATVRRYTNSGVLPHERTEGGQRRFRLRDVLALVREMDLRKKH